MDFNDEPVTFMQNYFNPPHFAKIAFKVVLNKRCFLSIHSTMLHYLLITRMDSDDPLDCYAACLQTNSRMKLVWKAWAAAYC